MKLKFLLAFIVLFTSSSAFASYREFKVLKEIRVPGDGGWDYLTMDNSERLLYVSHGTQVDVVNVDRAKVVGSIPNTPGVHGVALANQLSRGFTSNGRASTVTMFWLKNRKFIKEVPVGGNPDAILYEPYTNQVFTFNGRSQTATVLEGATGKVTATLDMGGKPEFAVSDNKGTVWVNVEDKNEILRIDAMNLTVTAQWTLAPEGQNPTGLAMDVVHRRLFSVCGNKTMVVMDADRGKVISDLPIGEHPDACAFDPKNELIFCSCGDGTLTVIHEDSPDTYTVMQTVDTQKGARTMALDLKRHRVYLAVADFGPVPEATADKPHPRPSILPGTFKILIVGR